MERAAAGGWQHPVAGKLSPSQPPPPAAAHLQPQRPTTAGTGSKRGTPSPAPCAGEPSLRHGCAAACGGGGAAAAREAALEAGSVDFDTWHEELASRLDSALRRLSPRGNDACA